MVNTGNRNFIGCRLDCLLCRDSGIPCIVYFSDGDFTVEGEKVIVKLAVYPVLYLQLLPALFTGRIG